MATSTIRRQYDARIDSNFNFGRVYVAAGATITLTFDASSHHNGILLYAGRTNGSGGVITFGFQKNVGVVRYNMLSGSSDLTVGSVTNNVITLTNSTNVPIFGMYISFYGDVPTIT